MAEPGIAILLSSVGLIRNADAGKRAYVLREGKPYRSAASGDVYRDSDNESPCTFRVGFHHGGPECDSVQGLCVVLFFG